MNLSTRVVGAPVAAAASATASATGLPPWFVAGSIWLGLGMILILVGLLFVLEAVTYYERQPAITSYVRAWSSHHWIIAIVVGLALVAASTAAFTHFVADAQRS